MNGNRAAYLIVIFVLSFLIFSAASCGLISHRYVIRYPASGNPEGYTVTASAEAVLYDSGRVMAADLSPGTLLSLGSDILPCDGPAVFRENGYPVLCTLIDPQALLFRKGRTIRILFRGTVQSTADGIVRAGHLAADAALPFGSGRMRILLPEGTSVWFSGEGILTSFQLSEVPKPRYRKLREQAVDPELRYIVDASGEIRLPSVPADISKL